MRQKNLQTIRPDLKKALMAKKRKGGVHKTPRQAVQIPVPWVGVARKIAIKRQQPMMWYLVALLGEAAKKEGITDLPKFPWDEELTIDQ